MASRKTKLAELPRNIVRRENKNGEYYYYNKKQGKITSKASWKAQNVRVEKRKEEIYEQERKHRQYLKRKREAAKEEEKRHRQYLKRKREAKKAKPAAAHKPVPAPVSVAKKQFPDFYFFKAIGAFANPTFDGVRIRVDISDPANDFSETFEDSAEEFPFWYTASGTLAHLREYHNDSPPARFRLVESDGDKFARYVIDVSE